MKLNKVMAVMVVSSALVLSGCSAMGTAIKKRNLEVKTQMSETIWLEPSNNKTVYLQIKNTSDKDMSGLQAKIASAVTSKGYQVVSNPDTAGYWIQANVLKADKMDLRESQGWLSRGYEGGSDWRRSWGGDYRLQLQFCGSNPGGRACGWSGRDGC